MLSLRLIRQLTESALLDRPAVSLCCRHTTATQWPSRAAAVAAPSSLSQRFSPSIGSWSLRQRPPYGSIRCSSSSTRWKSRQTKDSYAREAKVKGLKSRAAFKLLEMNERYRLFKAGNTVVDLGYAPGSWSQVAISRTSPNGRVVGIDVIPAQPPRGVSTIQGNFLSPAVQAEVRAYVQDPLRGRPIQRTMLWSADDQEDGEDVDGGATGGGGGGGGGAGTGEVKGGEDDAAGGGTRSRGYTEEDLEEQERGYIDMERRASLIARPNDADDGAGEEAAAAVGEEEQAGGARKLSKRERDEKMGRVVDVVLSDMSAPWDQTDGFYKRSITEPYIRMMNTSGIPFRDHAGSMDLCMAALTFAFDTLRTGGHFVCKYYQGAEDKALETKLRRLFEKVFREKPESSRSESKEAFFVALKRKADPAREDVFKE